MQLRWAYATTHCGRKYSRDRKNTKPRGLPLVRRTDRPWVRTVAFLMRDFRCGWAEVKIAPVPSGTVCVCRFVVDTSCDTYVVPLCATRQGHTDEAHNNNNNHFVPRLHLPRPEQSRPVSEPSPPMTSAPEGHSCREQSGPRNPASHLHPTCFSASQGVEYLGARSSKRRYSSSRERARALVLFDVISTP